VRVIILSIHQDLLLWKQADGDKAGEGEGGKPGAAGGPGAGAGDERSYEELLRELRKWKDDHELRTAALLQEEEGFGPGYEDDDVGLGEYGEAAGPDLTLLALALDEEEQAEGQEEWLQSLEGGGYER
jgi:hypothetical protein